MTANGILREAGVGHDALMARLQAMRIEPEGAGLTFVARLARENGWSRAFADRVLGEYRRFLFLAATADHAVTPSDAVDQAWHLHLGYSRHYWSILCADILGRPLHHGPTEGGPAERRRYDDQYRDTLRAYCAAFGHEPPSDIWPDAAIRFAPDRFERIDRSRHWVVPRRAANAAIIILPLLAGCVAWTTPSRDRAEDGSFEAVAFIAMFLVIGLLLQRSSERRRRRRRTRGSDADFESDSSGSSDSGDSGGSDGGSDSGCSSGCGGGGCGGGGD